MEFGKLKCSYCVKPFLRPNGQINEAKKFGWKQFCSPNCLAKSKLNGKRLICANGMCDKSFYRPLKEIKKVKKSFCSNNCAAIFYNAIRASKRPIKRCALSGCIVVIPRDQKYCSRSHGAAPRRIPKELHKKQIIRRIQNFYKTHKRVPVKREMYGIYRTARYLFGNWNNAIRTAGYKPNPIMFAYRYVACDGHECDSFAEKVIDDWLHEKDIRHERGVKYPGNPKLTADFVTTKHWIEFFGLSGELDGYDLLKRKKKRLAKKYKLPLIALHPNDLFPQNRLSEVLKI